MTKNMRTQLLVLGMRDNACRERIVETLERVAGVKQVDVSLFRFRATVVHAPECRPEELVRAVTEAGYQAQFNGAH